MQGRVAADFIDFGEHSLKNIARPVRVYRLDLAAKAATTIEALRSPLAPPDKPSIAALAFNNMSGDPDHGAIGSEPRDHLGVFLGRSLSSGSLS